MLKNKKVITQWVSAVLNVESKSNKSFEYLNSILGPVKGGLDSYINDQENLIVSNNEFEDAFDKKENDNNDFKDVFMHQIILKFDEKIFIEKINIYEKICPGSTVLKLEAYDFENDEWFLLWRTNKPLESSKPKIFTPYICPTQFKTDTIKLTVCGSMYLIDGIEVRGNNDGAENDGFIGKDNDTLSQDLKKLIANELFADIYFEVEGQIIPAHINILISRSEYFKKLINSHLKNFGTIFNPHKNPIYLKEMEYDVFMQIINYFYTGILNLDKNESASYLVIKVAKIADKLKLIELIKLCILHLSLTINENNVIQIFKEVFDLRHILGIILDFCYQIILEKFSTISQSEDFCSLDQSLMNQVVQNVVPRLIQIKNSNQNIKIENINEKI